MVARLTAPAAAEVAELDVAGTEEGLRGAEELLEADAAADIEEAEEGAAGADSMAAAGAGRALEGVVEAGAALDAAVAPAGEDGPASEARIPAVPARLPRPSAAAGSDRRETCSAVAGWRRAAPAVAGTAVAVDTGVAVAVPAQLKEEVPGPRAAQGSAGHETTEQMTVPAGCY